MSIFEVKSWPVHITKCLEFAVTVYFNRSILLTLALKTMTCVMALLVPAQPKFSPNLRYLINCRWGPNWELAPLLCITFMIHCSQIIYTSAIGVLWSSSQCLIMACLTWCMLLIVFGCKHGKVDPKMLRYPNIIVILIKCL